MSYKAGSYDPQVSFTLGQPLESTDYDFIEMDFESDVEGEGYIFLAQQNEQYSGKYSGKVVIKKGGIKFLLRKMY